MRNSLFSHFFVALICILIGIWCGAKVTQFTIGEILYQAADSCSTDYCVETFSRILGKDVKAK